MRPFAPHNLRHAPNWWHCWGPHKSCCTRVANPGLLQESLGPFGPEVVSPRVSPKTGGVRGSVRRGVSRAFRPPSSGVSKKCPESVPRVSKRCPGHFGDTLGTHFGHSGALGPKGPGDTPSDTFSDTPRFRGHSRYEVDYPLEAPERPKNQRHSKAGQK